MLNRSNEEAMHILRDAMSRLGADAVTCRITVLRVEHPYDRQIPSTSPPGSSLGHTETFGTAAAIDSSEFERNNSHGISGSAGLKHYSVPGYGDYAVVTKKSPTINVAREEKAVIVDDSNGVETTPKKSMRFSRNENYEEISAPLSVSKSEASLGGEESSIPDESVFDREAPTRQSMSEKRKAASHNDPTHLKTYQQIKHARQISGKFFKFFFFKFLFKFSINA